MYYIYVSPLSKPQGETVALWINTFNMKSIHSPSEWFVSTFYVPTLFLRGVMIHLYTDLSTVLFSYQFN